MPPLGTIDHLLAGRAQMGSSLAFHIVFASLGVGLPLMMVLAEGRALPTGDAVWLALARRWSKAFGILFAVGAVSGTIISFELGLLWPRFMGYAGAIVGLPFSLEGFAFFVEAIFLGIYLYGWHRLSPRTHLARSSLGVVFGAASVITPLLFGAAAGGLATGAIHYHVGHVAAGGAVWIGALPVASGVLAVAVCAYLAATFLCVGMERAGAPQLLEDFRRRALGAGGLAGGLSIAALPLAHADAPRLYERLTGVAAPAVALGIAAGAASLVALWWRGHRLARGACATAVAAVIWGWGIAQYPQLAGPDVTTTTAAARRAVLQALLVGGAAGLVVLVPSLWLLYGACRRPPITVDDR